MTKSSEGTMTAKEKVLKVWLTAVALDCHEIAGDYNIYSEDSPSAEHLGNGTSIEKAWQNAAESLPGPKVMTKADIDKLTEGFHRCGTSLLPLPRLNPECGCMCGTVYNREGEPIIYTSGRNGPHCKHADERGRLLSDPPASTNSPSIPAKEEEKDSEFYCSFTSSGEHAPSPIGDCLYCGSKGRPHNLRPAEVEAKDKPSTEQAAMRSREEWRRCALDAEASLESIKADHRELIDLIDRTLSCTSGYSFSECLEEIKRRLEK